MILPSSPLLETSLAFTVTDKQIRQIWVSSSTFLDQVLCEVAVMAIKGYYIVSTLKLANPCDAQVKAATI